MTKIALALLVTVVAAGGGYAGDFESRLSVRAGDIMVPAEGVKPAPKPAPAVKFSEPYPGWWKASDAERVKFKFAKLSVAVDQVAQADPVAMIGAQYSACWALADISYEGTVDPQNIDRVINWMLNDAEGTRGWLNKLHGFVSVWSRAVEDPAVIKTPVTHCVAEHSRYLQDRINGVAGASGFTAAPPAPAPARN